MYVPGTVSVTLKVWPWLMVMLEFAKCAPAGKVTHVTLCGATVSLSKKVIVVPAATVRFSGSKFSFADWVPTFSGITTFVVLLELEPDVLDEVVLLEPDVLLLPD